MNFILTMVVLTICGKIDLVLCFSVRNRKNSSLVCQNVQCLQLPKSVVNITIIFYLKKSEKDNNFQSIIAKLEHH